MARTMLLDELAEAVERLPDGDHEALFEKMKRRHREAVETRILDAAADIRREHAEGKSKASTPEELANAIFS